MYQCQDKTSKRRVREIRAYPRPIQPGVFDPINDTNPHGHKSNEKSLHVPGCVFELTSHPEYRDIQSN